MAMTRFAQAIPEDVLADSSLSSRCVQTDYWRSARFQNDRYQSQDGNVGGYKEWSHFCAFSDEISIIVNLSLMDHSQYRDGSVQQIPRVVILVKTSGGYWEGDIVQLPSSSVEMGPQQTDIRIGESSLRFVDGAYHVTVHCDALAAQLRFCPLARPAVASSVRLDRNDRMRWLVVPRLAAEGGIFVGNRSYVLKNAPAYHDRNWGDFCWGGDYSWEWATILPSSLSVPLSLVYMRIGDGSRNRTYSQGLMVWEGERSSRVFHGSDIQVKEWGLLQQHCTFRLPSIVNLMVPGKSSGVPGEIEIETRAWSDHLKVHLSVENYAQIGVPNDGPEGLTLLSEATAQAEVKGRLRGQDVQFRGRSLMEFKCGVQ